MKFQKLFYSAMLVSCLNLSATTHYEDFDLTNDQLFVPHHIATTNALRYRDGDFHLVFDGKEHRVACYNVKDFPSNLSSKGLATFLQFGYFAVGGNETEYTLQWQGRILGGGVLRSLEPKPSPTFPKLDDLDPDAFGKGLRKESKELSLLGRQ